MEKVFESSSLKIAKVKTDFIRYLYYKIDFSQRLIGIKGARGSGKTTLMLQYAKKLPAQETIYISLDNLYFSQNNLIDFVDRFVKIGGKYLFLDEVHKYVNWSQEIKNLYDTYEDLKIVFTGSSALEVIKGQYDLSRRALMYDLHGLSFREYLELKHQITFDPITLDEIISNPRAINKLLSADFKPYKYFNTYLEKGYFPFFIEDETNYLLRLAEVVNLVIETDLPMIYHIDYYSVIKLKKLLYVLGSMVPYIPNLKQLAVQIGTTRDSLLKYLNQLHNAHIIKWISKDAFGINFLNKPEKLYLNNTNLAYALHFESINIGTLREIFFLNQVSVNHKVTLPINGDFLVDNTYTFEVGGKNKRKKQLKNTLNAFVVNDNIERVANNHLPLWVFGFLY